MKIVKIESIGVRKIYDVSVNHDIHNFVLENGVVAHNSSTQPALRGFIEEFSRNCRFIFTANFGNKIIEPLKSRLAVIEFSFTKEERQKMAVAFDARIKSILAAEHVEFDKKVLAQVLVKYFPDFRKVLNELQKHSTGGSISTGIVTAMGTDTVTHLYGLLKVPSKWNEMRKWVVDNADNEFSMIVRALYDNAASHVKPGSIPQLILTLAEYDYKSGFVVDKEINTVAMLTEIMSNCDFI